jgi:hypothetical protein
MNQELQSEIRKKRKKFNFYNQWLSGNSFILVCVAASNNKRKKRNKLRNT